MRFETIIALDLGKFRSVACVMDAATRRRELAAVATTPAAVHGLPAARAGLWGGDVVYGPMGPDGAKKMKLPIASQRQEIATPSSARRRPRLAGEVRRSRRRATADGNMHPAGHASNRTLKSTVWSVPVALQKSINSCSIIQ